MPRRLPFGPPTDALARPVALETQQLVRVQPSDGVGQPLLPLDSILPRKGVLDSAIPPFSFKGVEDRDLGFRRLNEPLGKFALESEFPKPLVPAGDIPDRLGLRLNWSLATLTPANDNQVTEGLLVPR